MPQTITGDMQMFANVRTLLTDKLLAAINDSPTLVAQMLDYEAAVAGGSAEPISTGPGGAGYYAPTSRTQKQYIFLGQDNFSRIDVDNLIGKANLSKAIDAIAHEFGHFAARSKDTANWALAGTTENRVQSCLMAEGYAVFNNYIVKREIEATARLRGETPIRTLTGDRDGGLLALLDAIYTATNGSGSVDDYAAAIGNL